MSTFNVAILGAGGIAAKMAAALKGIDDQVCRYAVASRSIDKAQGFADKWGFEKAYGSYEELVNDPDVDLIYVATPHSHHYEHAKLCVEHGKAALVEKAFTANEKLSARLIKLAEEDGVFISEAMWTRFLPARHIIEDVIASGVLGEITSIEADFSMNLTHKDRLVKPELAGGALLDLGIYSLTFASMYFGDEYESVETECELYETGVDGTSETVYTYPDGKTAVLRTSMTKGTVNEGLIYGTEGSLYVKELNNYSSIIRRDVDGNEVQVYQIPPQVNGYEYEVLACKDAILAGKLECDEMPHSETLEIMRQMDALRKAWSVKCPFE